jgi:hypothetical protein
MLLGSCTFQVAPGQGLEPRFAAPKADVLPIGRSRNSFYLICSASEPVLEQA